MKKQIVTILACVAALSVMAQGTVNFVNTVTGNMRAPVYGPEVGDNTVSKVGNTSAGLPAGTQVYTGALLTGAGWTAQLWAATGAGAPESSLQAAIPTSTFRTGSAAGYFVAQTGVLTGVPKDAPAATVQLRVWDNMGGTITTWEQAETAWLAGTIAAGMSPLLTVNAIGGDINFPPNLTGLQSFNVFYVIPEPSTFALLGLGALGMFLFRRK